MPEMTVAELIELIEALAAEPNQLLRGQSGSRGGFPLMLRPPTEPLDPMDLPF